MKILIIFIFGIFLNCQAFDEARFLADYCTEIDSYLECKGFNFDSSTWSDFANRTFTISNAKDVYLEGYLQFLNEYLFEKFPSAKKFIIKDSGYISLTKPFVRDSNKKLSSSIEEFRLKASLSNTYKSSSFNSLSSLKIMEINSDLQYFDEYLLVKNTKLIDLKMQSYLKEISPKAFKNLKKLSNLDLSGNKLSFETLDPKVFSPLTKLRTLNMRSNYLSFPPLGSFWPSSLEHLDLSANNIFTITKHHFKNLKNLITLDLSQNHINILSRDSFQANKKLVSVSLQSNSIPKIHEILFPNQKYLKNLNFYNNRLREIRKFDGAPVLENLNASSNLLGILDNESFSESVVTLDFSHNSLTSMAFPNSSNLKYLYLQRNSIDSKYVNKDTFAPVPNLEIIDLGENNIRTVADDAFDDLDNLSIIKY